MKIGVITFWFGNSNYGQILQCWALQYFLKINGHDPYVIKYLALGESWVKCLLRRVLNKKEKLNKNDALRDFEGFRKHNLRFTRLYTSLLQIQSNPPKFDAYIAGSDQIWVQSLDNPQVRPYFLDFGSKDIKHIAYAPSFGMKYYPEQHKPLLGMLLSKMDAVSCREYSGVDICKDVGIKAEKVLDPTLLLKKEDYIRGLGLNIGGRSGLFIYSLNIDSSEEVRWSELKQLADNKCWNIIVTPAAGYTEGKELFGNSVNYLYSTPNQWLEQIANSEIVVTTSFHGIVFSIIMQTPFVYVPLSGSHAKSNNRVLDLLLELGLANRVLKSDSKYEELILDKINWEEVNRKVFDYRLISRSFLLGALC